MSYIFSFALCWLLLSLTGFGVSIARGQTSETPLSPSRRVKVSETVASSLVTEKTPLKYPDAARNAGIQGTVVLKVVVAENGEVKEVTPISGDPHLTQASADTVKLWKYKPYMVDGAPVEMETQVSINFHVRTPERAAPSLGTFRDGIYSNDFFDFEYPLSRDWVRETEAMRKRLSAGAQSSPGMYVLLAAIHIPQQTAPLEADSSFVLWAVDGGGRNCSQYLNALADSLHSQKEAQEKGTVTPLIIAGRDFERVDLDFRQSPSHRSFLCTQSKDYLLQWNIVGLSKTAVESFISTLNEIGSMRHEVPAGSSSANSNAGATPNKSQAVGVRVAQGISQGLIVKKVTPIYPQQAKYAHIQGSVVMSVVINKSGDVTDLEVVDGPIELAVSAVNAVRQWKYRPYILNGEPVEVDTHITVNYTLTGGL
jgi:TonB family protein